MIETRSGLSRRLTHRKGFSDMKRRKRNTDLFGRWVLSLMERSAPRKRDPSKETFDTTGVRINPIHNEYLPPTTSAHGTGSITVLSMMRVWESMRLSLLTGLLTRSVDGLLQ